MNDEQFLKKAIMNAKESVAQGGFPAGAIVVESDLPPDVTRGVGLRAGRYGAEGARDFATSDLAPLPRLRLGVDVGGGRGFYA